MTNPARPQGFCASVHNAHSTWFCIALKAFRQGTAVQFKHMVVIVVEVDRMAFPRDALALREFPGPAP